jgi:hypothetical protein
MGQRVTFECTQCGYQAVVSGGPDRGMDTSTETISCEECRALYDVVTAKLAYDTVTGKATGFDTIPIHCPKSADHKVKPWERGGPCPNCGNSMPEKTSGWRTISMWD